MDGTEYVSGGLWFGEGQGVLSNLEVYPLGREVAVRYDPARPSSAVLRPGQRRGDGYLAPGLAAALLLGSLCLCAPSRRGSTAGARALLAAPLPVPQPGARPGAAPRHLPPAPPVTAGRAGAACGGTPGVVARYRGRPAPGGCGGDGPAEVLVPDAAAQRPARRRPHGPRHGVGGGADARHRMVRAGRVGGGLPRPAPQRRRRRPRPRHPTGTWVREVLPGKLLRPPADLELITRACDWHVCPDRAASWDHPTLWLLKDADGLDRVRLYDLDPRFLRHPGTKQWVDAAGELFRATDGLDRPRRVWERAAAYGLPVAELLAFVEAQAANLRSP